MTADIPASVRLAARLSLVTPSAMTSAVMLTFSNSTTNNTQATFGACSFAVRLYRDSTVTGNPVWDNRPPPNADCILPLYVVSLGSRESADRQVGVLDVAAAARALPAGRYRVAVAWRSSATGPVQTVVGEMISLPWLGFRQPQVSATTAHVRWVAAHSTDIAPWEARIEHRDADGQYSLIATKEIRRLHFAPSAPLRPAGNGQRTGRRDRARRREHGQQHEQIARASDPVHQQGDRTAANRAPRGEVPNGKLVKPPVTAHSPENAGERRAGEKPEQAEEERERDVRRVRPDDHQQRESRKQPGRAPGEPNADGAAQSLHPSSQWLTSQPWSERSRSGRPRDQNFTL